MAKSKTQYVCQQCGRTSVKPLGRCPQCDAWNSMVAEVVTHRKSTVNLGDVGDSQPRRVAEISAEVEGRIPLAMNEFARVLGGGVIPGSVVLIGGDPGIGKSTLLGIFAGHVPPDAGSVRWGHATSLGYLPQNHAQLLKETTSSALDYLWSFCPTAPVGQVRSQLGRVLFSGDDVHKTLGVLSGGESARLIFAQLATQQPNVLLLDEPTNHLDLEAIDALVQVLERYEGTLLFVSHDRWFVSRIATRILELTNDGRHDFPGTYEEYLAACGDDHLDSEAVALRFRQQRSRASADAERLRRKREQRREQARLKALPQQRDNVVQAMEAAEARKAEITAQYCQPDFFRDASAEQLASLKREEAELETRLASLMAEWEVLETELDASLSDSKPTSL